jgi:cytoskeleton protein RodZ
VPSLGAQLKQAREQRGVGLDEVAQTTKIGTRFLLALESDHYEQLPGGIFNKGFIRAYARAVGLDEEQAIADYIAATEPGVVKTEHPSQPPSRTLEPRIEAEVGDSGDLPWGALAIVLVLVALGLAGWGFYSRESHKVGNVPVPSPAEATPTSGEQPPPEENSTPPQSSTGQPSSTPVASADKGATTTAKSTENPTSPASDAEAGSSEYFSVRVNVREDSWLSMSADGKPILQGKFLAPAQKSVKARNQVVVQTQNAGGVEFEFNGHTVPAQGKPGEFQTLIFGVDGLEAVQETAQPDSPQPPQD